VKDARNNPGSTPASPGPGSTSSGLLDGVKRHDPEAWCRLAHLYGPLVYGWCRRAGLQARDAEDVLQEVFLTVAARVGEFRHDRAGDTFRGWLRTITHHKLGDWMRRQAKREKAAGGSEALGRLLAVPDMEATDSEAEETTALYHRALDAIRAEFEGRTWQAFWRVVVEEQSPADVAADLELTRNAVYIARSRVLRRLREELGAEGA
jgi:RNA polymerase sigma-70 factor (ECF subfamily)